ncbi:hypothetical protein [Haloglycomyces albus]|uniref:hypothetical protein n=1 Tax=Haloglycomyces albus TaxID=526067 RepID=UPI00046D61C4|nr:hypothetical protein [Haloglycomyces albus]
MDEFDVPDDNNDNADTSPSPGIDDTDPFDLTDIAVPDDLNTDHDGDLNVDDDPWDEHTDTTDNDPTGTDDLGDAEPDLFLDGPDPTATGDVDAGTDPDTNPYQSETLPPPADPTGHWPEQLDFPTPNTHDGSDWINLDALGDTETQPWQPTIDTDALPDVIDALQHLT